MSRIALYKEVYTKIYNKIKNKELSPGTLLNSERDLTLEYNVSRDTIRKALLMLVKNGILNTLARVGYEVNDLTPKKKVKENIIGVILNDGSNPDSFEFLNNIEKIFHENNYSIVLGFNQNETKLENENIEKFMHLDIKGIVIIPATRGSSKTLLNGLITKDFPTVLLGQPREWKIKKNLINKTHIVCEDNESCILQCLNHLESLGHKEICFIKPYDSKYISIREKSFVKFRGKKSAQIIKLDKKYYSEKNIEALKLAVEAKNKPTAFISYNIPLGISAIRNLEELGYLIPNDFSVVGIGQINKTELDIFPLTNINPKGNEWAEKIFLSLDSQIKKKKIENRLMINYELVVRGSTSKLLT